MKIFILNVHTVLLFSSSFKSVCDSLPHGSTGGGKLWQFHKSHSRHLMFAAFPQPSPRIHQQAGFSQEPKHECLISGSCCEMCASLTATYQLHLWVWISLYDHYYMHACLIFQALLLRGKYLNSLNSFKKHVVAFDVVEYMIEYATYSICYLFLKHFLY